MTDNSQEHLSGNERRKYARIEKHFIFTFFKSDSPDDEHSVSQVKNISRGGILFSSSIPLEPKTKIQMAIKTPYMAGTLDVEGKILSCIEKIPGVIYEIRVEILDLSDEIKSVFKKIEEDFLKSKGSY